MLRRHYMYMQVDIMSVAPSIRRHECQLTGNCHVTTGRVATLLYFVLPSYMSLYDSFVPSYFVGVWLSPLQYFRVYSSIIRCVLSQIFHVCNVSVVSLNLRRVVHNDSHLCIIVLRNQCSFHFSSTLLVCLSLTILFIYYNIYNPRNFNYLNQMRWVAGGRKFGHNLVQ